MPPTRSLSLLGAVGLVILAAFGAALTAGFALGVEMLRHDVALPQALEALRADPLLLSICQLGGAALAIGAGVIAVHGADARIRDALVVRPVPVTVAILAIGAGLALQFPLSELTNLLAHVHPAFELDAETAEALRRMTRIDSTLDAFTVPLAIVAVPAISEELLFRGLLQPALSRRHGPTLGLVATALLFGLVHGAPAGILVASLAGLVLGLVRERTGSVLPCIAMHGAFNAVPILLPPELVRIEGFNTSGVHHQPIALTLGSTLLAVVCLVVMARLRAGADER